MSAQPLIQLEHVTKAYPGVDEPAVRTSTNVNPGEILVLVGPSGCVGTTLRLINRGRGRDGSSARARTSRTTRTNFVAVWVT